MNRFSRSLCMAMSVLMLLGGLASQVSANDTCLGEVLSETGETTVYAVITDMKLPYKIKKGTELNLITDQKGEPKPKLDKEGRLEGEFEFLFKPEGSITGTYDLGQKTLEVQTANGQRYRLREGTSFGYTLPPTASRYKVKMPNGTRLTPTNTTPPKYFLQEDKTTTITPPKNYQVELTIAAKQKVDRVPGTSGPGTTLQVDPKYAPEGGNITVVVKKSDFNFNKARFQVCFRLRTGKPNTNPFVPSDDIELQEVKMGEAKLRVRVPDVQQPFNSSTPTDLLVVAHGEDGALAEVVSKEFSVSSHGFAILAWIVAFVIAFVCCSISIPKESVALRRSRLNPVRFAAGKSGRTSLSLAQILLWSILVFSASFYVFWASGKLLALTPQVLVLLGIAGGSSVIAKIASSMKDGKGRGLMEAELKAIIGENEVLAPKTPRLIDLVQTEERPDLFKFQMALFTVLAAFYVIIEIFRTYEFPQLPEGLLVLIGISNGVYLTSKGAAKTVFENLVEKEREFADAQATYEKRKAEAEEKGRLQKDAEKAKKDAQAKRDETEKNLKEALAKTRENLKKLLEQQNAALENAKTAYEKISVEKAQADADMKSAEESKVKIEKELNKIKEQAGKELTTKSVPQEQTTKPVPEVKSS